MKVFIRRKLRRTGCTGFALNFLFQFFFSFSESDQLFHHTQVHTGLSKFGASTCASFAGFCERWFPFGSHNETRRDAKVLKCMRSVAECGRVFLIEQKNNALKHGWHNGIQFVERILKSLWLVSRCFSFLFGCRCLVREFSFCSIRLSAIICVLSFCVALGIFTDKNARIRRLCSRSVNSICAFRAHIRCVLAAKPHFKSNNNHPSFVYIIIIERRARWETRHIRSTRSTLSYRCRCRRWWVKWKQKVVKLHEKHTWILNEYIGAQTTSCALRSH